MRQQILDELEKIEKDHEIRILYACESGSRAWGFNSSNSDFDVRFIYVHKLDWYLSTVSNRDVIEQLNGDLDISGWEIRKALKLLAKGNPPMLEWLYSPIVYKVDPIFYNKLLTLSNNCFSPKTAIYHYISMAKRNYNQYIKDKAYVKYKKYLYVIRPLLNCIAIQEQGKMPPTQMDLSQGLLKPYKAYPDILALIGAKKAGLELATAPSSQVLNEFIEELLFFFELYVIDAKVVNIDYKALDVLLNNQVMEFTNEK